MCGIAGYISSSTSVSDRERAVRKMCAAMHHRGPDDHGWTTAGRATLGSCRLAIFDPANGRQPMVTPDGRWTVVFNGAIYNFRALREELSRRGHAFRTECDTEVLLHALAAWGTDAVSRLRGMFAFAAWDSAEQQLVLARDAFGIKPLYLYKDQAGLVFASELNALVRTGAVPVRIDPAAVAHHLAWLAVPAPQTIYRDVVSLRPGETALFRDGRLTIRSWWTFSTIPAGQPCTTYDEFVATLRTRLEDTIRAHMLADVPVGAFLSGGLDSAAIVGLMTHVGGKPLRTFCIGFDDPEFSESSAAEESARHFGSIHHTEVLTGSRVADDMGRLLDSLDQPTGDGINTFYASQAARAGGVTVALSGLGGDELFGGYPAFRDTPRLARLIPAWRTLPRPVRTAVLSRLRRSDTRRRKLADVLENASTLNEVGALQRRVFSRDRQQALLHPDLLRSIGRLEPLHPEAPVLDHDLRGAAAFDVVSAWELRTYMADVLLRDSDVMSMRHSLELRVPFVDRPLIEWLWRQPAKARGERPKSALYDAVADLVPHTLRERRKHGFTLPFEVWMRRELRPFLEDTFSSESVARSGMFSVTEVQALWREFQSENDSRQWSRVWSLAVLIAFANRRTPAVAHAQHRPAEEHAIRAQNPKSRRATLLMAPEIFASEGGIPRILQLYLRALGTGDHGGRVHLLALNDGPADMKKAGLHIGSALDKAEGCSREKLRFVRRTLALARDCDTIVCGHVGQLPVAWMAKKLNPSLRYYLVAHGIEVWRQFTAAERIALRGTARVLCVSDFTRRELLKNCPLPDGRAVVLHNALDPRFEIRAGRPLRECPPTILVVTRLTYADRYKGVQHMIEAMAAVRAALPGAKLRIVGRGDDLERLKRIARDNGVFDVVEFTGFVDDARLVEEMRSCRLFALPSRKEGFGLVFLEAMAHGRPCLGADAGGIPEVISPDTGVLVPYGDVTGIAAATIDALRRDWDEDRILARARDFSFDVFHPSLADHLTA